jgi:hypothetical protein
MAAATTPKATVRMMAPMETARSVVAMGGFGGRGGG